MQSAKYLSFFPCVNLASCVIVPIRSTRSRRCVIASSCWPCTNMPRRGTWIWTTTTSCVTTWHAPSWICSDFETHCNFNCLFSSSLHAVKTPRTSNVHGCQQREQPPTGRPPHQPIQQWGTQQRWGSGVGWGRIPTRGQILYKHLVLSMCE